MRLLAAAAALPVVASAPGGAQPPAQAQQQQPRQQQRLQRAPALRTIRVGERIESRLPPETDDAHEDFRLPLQENDSVEILMQSPAAASPAQAPGAAPAQPRGFDTYLELRRLVSAPPLATNDDRGDGSYNSRLIFTAPAAGDYLVRARPLGMVQAGADPSYALEVRALPRPPAPAPFTGRAEGDLGHASPVIDPGGGQAAAYAAYWFTGAASERVRIAMTSNGSEPGVQLIGPDGAAVAADLADEHGAAQIVAVLPQEGRYLIQALALREQPAHYVLEMTRAMPAPFEPARPIAVDQAIEDAFTLASNSNLTGGGPSREAPFFYKLYALPVQAGRPV
ncbi:MAG: hypothetical protein JO276_05430, partial [Sphingomonadaceae bacterium]|nr:hypothetical protein [Sphingomonadaceae bacterium]